MLNSSAHSFFETNNRTPSVSSQDHEELLSVPPATTPHVHGGRNQYREIKRFENEEHFQKWMAAQSKQWGIVQKGRITVEDIIDQYACVYRRRKGYNCRVQMRVRHNRRSGTKVVEVLNAEHDHTFHPGILVPPGMGANANSPQPMFGASATFIHNTDDAMNSDEQAFSPFEQQTHDMEMKDESNGKAQLMDLNSLISQITTTSNDNEQQIVAQQQIEMLMSNIINQQFGSDKTTQIQNNAHLSNGNMDVEQPSNEELFAELVAEKTANCISKQIEPMFSAIISTLNSLSNSVEELKRNQHRPTFPSSASNGSGNNSIHQSSINKSSSSISFRPFSISQVRNPEQRNGTFVGALQRKQNSNATGLINSEKRKLPAQEMTAGNNASTTMLSSSASTFDFPLLEREDRAGANNNGTLSFIRSAHGEAPSLTLSSLLKINEDSPSSSIFDSATNHFGEMMASDVNTPMKSMRKSVSAYRQRRRELSYKTMKEMGLTVTINNVSKSVYQWAVTDIYAAIQTKRREHALKGKRVMYHGEDVTEKLYRVDCSRCLVNGRRVGQMIADSLWPRGYFKRRMLMPILHGVNHKIKRRLDGSTREAVQNEQFDVFKEALLLLGGFLIDEADRFKWMETAREGVNQRGLDELASSKRAHYEYEGGPLFAEECTRELEKEPQQANLETAYASLLSTVPLEFMPQGSIRVQDVDDDNEGEVAEMKCDGSQKPKI